MIYFDKDNLHTDQYGKINFSKTKGSSQDIALYHAKGKYGSIDIKEIHDTEFSICEFSVDTSEVLDITSVCREGLGLTVPVKRFLQYSVKYFDEELPLLHYSLSHTPCAVKGTYTFTKGRYTIFSILFSREYVEKSNETLLTRFLKNAKKDQPTILSSQLPATGKMMFIVHELFLGRPFPEKYRYARVSELLHSAIEQRDKSRILNRTRLINQRDRLKLEQVKKHLEEHMADDPGTIEEIAKVMGINSLKLKQGFKKLYGVTIFGYITKLRMEKAKSLLLNSRLDMRQIASDVGYGHLSNFSNAFKRNFGHAPTVYREDQQVARSAQKTIKAFHKLLGM